MEGSINRIYGMEGVLLVKRGIRYNCLLSTLCQTSSSIFDSYYPDEGAY